MGVGDTLVRLGRFLDDCEERDLVRDVELTETRDDADGPVVADLAMTAPRCASTAETEFELDGATIDADGKLTVSFESTTSVIPVNDHDVVVDVTDTTHENGDATIELHANVELEPPADSTSLRETLRQRDASSSETGITVTVGDSQTSDDPEPTTPTSQSDRDVPPFRDRELLREVYESCDTFAEMPEALGMDVTAETVRRYMIRQDIHEPTSYNTSSDDAGSITEPDAAEGDSGGAETTSAAESTTDDVSTTGSDGPTSTTDDDDSASTSGDDDPATADLESPAVLADGIGLPDDVTIDTIVEAVRTSNTIYEVKQGIGIEREDALEMLKELSLLEFVAGRLATEAEREVSREQIIGRLREQADNI